VVVFLFDKIGSTTCVGVAVGIVRVSGTSLLINKYINIFNTKPHCSLITCKPLSPSR
jgi:hypothetical protein